MKNKTIYGMLHIDSSIVCPADVSDGLDSSFRRRVQNPSVFLKPFVCPGMDVLDLGCGTGFCTFDIANLVGPSGSVTAADLQQEMLDKLTRKPLYKTYSDIIHLHRCAPDSIGLTGPRFDFINIFYMFHEMPDHAAALSQLVSLLKPGGKMLISEPRVHVSGSMFEKTLQEVRDAGLGVVCRPRVFFSRSVVVGK